MRGDADWHDASSSLLDLALCWPAPDGELDMGAAIRDVFDLHAKFSADGPDACIVHDNDPGPHGERGQRDSPEVTA